MVRPPQILVIDSGIGGLSVTRYIRNICPYARITYIADLAHFPYGQKTNKELILRITNLVDHGLKRSDVDIVIIACNTASTVVLDRLRLSFDVPFVGVVPAIKPAAQTSVTGVIGVLATHGTVSGNYTKKLIHDFAGQSDVYLLGSSNLVFIAEQKMRGQPTEKQSMFQDVSRLIKLNLNMDTVVLACTHFPLLKDELKELFPKIKFWVDSGEAIARRVEYLLRQNKIGYAPPKNEEKNIFLITENTQADYHTPTIEHFLGVHETQRITL